MNIKDISKLADLMESRNLSLVEVTEEGKTIRLERMGEVIPHSEPAAVQHVPQITGAPASELKVDSSNVKVIKSPTVGVFYASASPESESFVQCGSIVKKGDVLCIIEAMKLMNEITSDVDGEVVEVCIGNGQVVEYGQALFKIK